MASRAILLSATLNPIEVSLSIRSVDRSAPMPSLSGSGSFLAPARGLHESAQFTPPPGSHTYTEQKNRERTHPQATGAGAATKALSWSATLCANTTYACFHTSRLEFHLHVHVHAHVHVHVCLRRVFCLARSGFVVCVFLAPRSRVLVAQCNKQTRDAWRIAWLSAMRAQAAPVHMQAPSPCGRRTWCICTAVLLEHTWSSSAQQAYLRW